MEEADRHGARSRTDAVYVISVAAELAGVHPQTLRIYERKGLVDPARTAGGSRRYSDDDIALLRRIQELTNDGLNLAGVQRVLALEAETRRLQAESRQPVRSIAETSPTSSASTATSWYRSASRSSCTRAAAGAVARAERRRSLDAPAVDTRSGRPPAVAWAASCRCR